MKSSCWILLGAVLAAGCGGGTAPGAADPTAAKAALQQALDAWQRGDPPERLLEGRPSIRVLDREWTQGHRLLRYEIGSQTPFAADQRFQVVLTLQVANRPAVKKKAVYLVGTSPAITVAREEDT
ncbi:MAG: hypothetical protein U0840_01550 [Gemmataceae bacterium]